MVIQLSQVALPAALMPSRWAFAALGHLADLQQALAPNSALCGQVFDTSAIVSMLYMLVFVAFFASFTVWRMARVPA